MAKAPDSEKGKVAVVVSMADASRDLARQKRRRADPAPGEARAGVSPGKWNANSLGLPADKGCECPIIPLGVEGETMHLIDSSGQFRSMKASDFSHAGIQSLFAATPNYPQWAWPRWGRAPAPKDGEPPKPPPVKSFEDDKVREALFLACTRKGLFSPSDKLRGRGAWTMKSGAIVYHGGEELWLFDPNKERPVALETGEHEGFLYARFPALPAPWTEPIAVSDNPSGLLLEIFRKWNWTRPAIDPVLLLGWIGVAYLGGALDWRSAVLLLGDKGTGKSSLQDGLKSLFGEALFHSADTTAAGIYQRMKNDTRPIALDELEPGADERKVQNVVQLMRDASSGALGRRGGSDGSPSEFQMRSAFLFSAINNPLHQAQDLSRVATLRLAPLDVGQTKPPAIDADTCGRKILAVLMREWPRFDERLGHVMQALADGGHDARGQRTYGTLIAVADLMLGPELADELNVASVMSLEGQLNMAGLAWWTDNLSADSLPEVEDALPNWRACIDWLLTNQVDAWRGGHRATVGKCIADLVEAHGQASGGYSIENAKRDLGDTGLGLELVRDLIAHKAKENGTSEQEAAARLKLIGGDDRMLAGFALAVPNDHPLVRKLYVGQPWQNGGWKDAMRQCPVPGVIVSDKDINRVYIGGVQKRCTLVVMGRYQGAPER